MFREFLDHLDRAARRRAAGESRAHAEGQSQARQALARHSFIVPTPAAFPRARRGKDDSCSHLNLEPTVASVFAPRTRIDADGTVEGYASLFGEIDQARDMVMAGAFAADACGSAPVQRIPMLFQHDPAEPVGVWLELREDHRGLYARGRLIPEVARGRELLSLLRRRRDRRAVDRLSHRQGPHRSADARAQRCSRSTCGRFPSSRSRCWRGRACAR